MYRQTPKPFDTTPDTGLSWEQVVRRHLSFLDQNEAIKKVYFTDPQPIDHFGLPVAYADMGNSFVIRAQRATFQYWKANVPWAEKGEVTVANGGDLAKEAGLWPAQAVVPEQPPMQRPPAPTTTPTPTPLPLTSTPTATLPTPTSAPPTPTPGPSQHEGAYRARSPEYGMSVFIWGHPDTTERDLSKLVDARYVQMRPSDGEIPRSSGGRYSAWPVGQFLLNLPNMSGFRLLRLLRQDPVWSGTPVVVTAYDFAEVEEVAEKGPAAFVTKPFDPRELVDKVRYALSKGRGSLPL